MRELKYLPLYYKWMKTGYIREYHYSDSYGGLCSTLLSKSPLFFDMFCIDKPYSQYWAYDGNRFLDEPKDVEYKFTPTRQNIVLFLAVMNNEL